jgi:hypothetical protein
MESRAVQCGIKAELGGEPVYGSCEQVLLAKAAFPQGAKIPYRVSVPMALTESDFL